MKCRETSPLPFLKSSFDFFFKSSTRALFQLRQFDKDYEEERAYIVTMMRVGAFTSYGFVWLFLFVAFISSGRNRDILKGRKCCRSHIVCILILTMILMCFIYVITLISVSMIGVPLMVASMTLKVQAAVCPPFFVLPKSYQKLSTY